MSQTHTNPTVAVQRGGSFGALAVGNFTGNGFGDVGYLIGEQAILATAPRMVESYDFAAVGIVVYDLATRRNGNTRYRDGLALATPGGVMQWDPIGPMPRLDQRVYARLCTADLDADGVDDVFGFNAAGSRVYLKALGPGAATPPVAEFTFAGEFAQSVATIDWNGDGVREIAISTNQRLVIRDAYAGNTLFSYPIASVTSELVELTSGNQSLVAWKSRAAQGRETLTIVGNGTFETQLLPYAYLGAMCAGDVNRDGKQDLAIVFERATNAIVLMNQRGVPGATSLFSPSAGKQARFAFDYSLPVGALNTSRIWVGDLDSDGMVEGVAINIATGKLSIANLSLGGTAAAPLRPEVVGVSAFPVFSSDPAFPNDIIGLNMSLSLTHSSTPPAGANALQLLLYDAVLRYGEELSEFRTQPLLQTNRTALFSGGVAAATMGFRVSVPAGYDYATIGDYNRAFAGLLRYVEIDANGDVIRAFAPRYVGIGLNNHMFHLPTFPGNPQLRYSPGGGVPTSGYVDPPRLPVKVTTAVVPVAVY
ncbi:MAG: hypothetical protein RLZZ562_2652 [Planctomycetota bacterium]|jgi:hypothetical protein